MYKKSAATAIVAMLSAGLTVSPINIGSTYGETPIQQGYSLPLPINTDIDLGVLNRRLDRIESELKWRRFHGSHLYHLYEEYYQAAQKNLEKFTKELNEVIVKEARRLRNIERRLKRARPGRERLNWRNAADAVRRRLRSLRDKRNKIYGSAERIRARRQTYRLYLIKRGVALPPKYSTTGSSNVDADFSKYCRTKFNNNQYRVVSTRRGVRHFCYQGRTPYTINLAEACRLTTGSSRYQKSGRRILCFKRKATHAAATSRSGGAPDFNRYCRLRHPGSYYVRRSGRATHLCKQPGRTQGFVLHNVDLAEACRVTHGTRSYRKTASRVVCTKSTVSNGKYRLPSGAIYRGPLKNGKPHGIGAYTTLRNGSRWAGRFRQGQPVGAHLQRRRNGRQQCIDLASTLKQRRLVRLPISRCRHLQRYLLVAHRQPNRALQTRKPTAGMRGACRTICKNQPNQAAIAWCRRHCRVR